MSVIFIPSKKIYDVNHKKISNNAITKIEQSFYGITNQFGNVLSKEYYLRFLDADLSIDISTAVLYENPSYNYGFIFDLVTENGLPTLKSTMGLPIDKLTQFLIGTNENGETILTSHQLKTTRRISADGGATFKEKTELKVPIISGYNRSEKIIYLKYSVVLQENDELTYSDNISLVGDYIITSDQTQTIGEGDKILYLPSNELIQAGNTNLTKFADDILANYGKGKEVATLLCSIGEYYDENGNLVISTNTADKMIFDHYDQVLPMVRSSWGTDVPISFNSSGNAKVFEVLGIRIYNDGEVRQELKIREVGETAFQIQLPAPILSISDNIITITDISGQATAFDIYLLGNLIDTVVDGNTFDIETLSLGGGDYTIYAVSRADGYKDSEKSKSIRFSVAHTTYYTEPNEAGGVTYYITSSKYTISNGTYIIGG